MVDQRADQRPVLARIADRQARIGLDQPVGEIGADRPVDDQAAQRGAALPGRADGGEHDRPHRHVEIGGRGDDHGVVAAEFEDRAAEPRGDLGPTIEPMRVEPVAETSGTWRDSTSASPDRRAADDDLGEAFGRVGAEALDRAVEDLHRRQRGERRLLRRLPDHRIAADERERRVPGPDGDREIERRNDRAGPERMPGLRHPVAGPLRGDGEAVQLPRQADGEIADVDHLLHFAQALRDDLADLERDERAERLLRGAQLLAEQTHELAAPGAGTSRQARKALRARSMTAGMASGGVSRMRAISAPSIGERTESEPPPTSAGVNPARSSTSSLAIGSPRRLIVSRTPPAKPLFDPNQPFRQAQPREQAVRSKISAKLLPVLALFFWSMGVEADGVAPGGSRSYLYNARARAPRGPEPDMTRSTNILLACAAMLAAMLLAVVLTPHRSDGAHPRRIRHRQAPADRFWRLEAGRRVERGCARPPGLARTRESTTRRRRAASSTRTDMS